MTAIFNFFDYFFLYVKSLITKDLNHPSSSFINFLHHFKLKSCVLMCMQLRSKHFPHCCFCSSSEFKERKHWLINSSKERMKKIMKPISVWSNEMFGSKQLQKSVSHHSHSCCVLNFHIGIFSCILMEPYLQNWTCESVTISEPAQVIFWAELCKCIPRCRARLWRADASRQKAQNV